MMKTNREGGDGEQGFPQRRRREFVSPGMEANYLPGSTGPDSSPGNLHLSGEDASLTIPGASPNPGASPQGLSGVVSGMPSPVSYGSNPQEITDSAFGGPQPFDLAGGQDRFASVLGLNGAGGMDGVPAQQVGPVGLAGVNRGGFGFNRGGGGGMRAME